MPEGRGVSVNIIVYDLLGRAVQTIINGSQKPGSYEVTFNGSNLSSGIYFYKLNGGNYSEVKKLILLK